MVLGGRYVASMAHAAGTKQTRKVVVPTMLSSRPERERENKRERGAEPGEGEGEGEGEARHPLSRPSACGVWSPEVQR